MTDYIDDIFYNTGVLAQQFIGYHPREGQVLLARAIDEAFAFNQHLIAEGPCGTGKSAAALIPASWHAADHRQKTIYVTAGINLQEQLVTKDLPLLKTILPWKDKFTFGLLKGRGNYLCVDSYLEFEKKQVQSSLFNEPGRLDGFVRDAEAKKHLPILRAWADDAMRGKHNGDVSTLPFQPHREAWQHFSTTADDCRGRRCKHAEECFALTAQNKAKSSDIIVTNYHLFYQNLAVWGETALDLVLPAFDAAILDEVHKATQIAEDFFGFSIHAGSFKWLAKKLGKDNVLGDSISVHAENLFHDLTALKHNREKYNKRLRERVKSRHIAPLQSVLEQAVIEFTKRVNDAKEDDDKAKEEKIRDRAKALLSNLSLSMNVVPGEPGSTLAPDAVYFLNEADHRISIQSKLVNPADVLRRLLWSKTKNERRNEEDHGEREEGESNVIVGPRINVVAMSATLANGRGDLSYASRSLGAYGEARLVTDSPFDWGNQCLFVVPETSTDGRRPWPENPNSDVWQSEMGDAIVDIVTWARGRTLCLFTSYRNLEYAANVLAKFRPSDPLTGVPFTIYKQGDLPRTQLIEAFRNNVSSVLLGTESFWAGVDVPGESLSCVIIDRLPFASPDDPVMDVIAERNPKSWFGLFALPRTIIALRQGFGRGVRSENDRCIVVCLDRRIATKQYGAQMRKALPPVPKSTKVTAIKKWLDETP